MGALNDVKTDIKSNVNVVKDNINYVSHATSVSLDVTSFIFSLVLFQLIAFFVRKLYSKLLVLEKDLVNVLMFTRLSSTIQDGGLIYWEF